jgi:mRNA interferase HicA
MKRAELLKYLRSKGCELIREGRRHSWWGNPAQNKRSSVPRYSEINDDLARKICKDLGIEPIK